MNDPINMELVQQLDSYISDVPDGDDSEKKEIEHESLNKGNAEKETKHSSMSITHRSKSSPSALHSSSPQTPKIESPNEGEGESKSNEASSENNEPKEENAKPEAKPEKGEEVETSKYVSSSSQFMSNVDHVTDSMDSIKGLLNSSESTSGITRLTVKENELWCYYDDSVNMNDIMDNVIETLCASGYCYLEFNRLARSDNAIVFEITPGTSTTINSVEESETNE